jgi:tRNA threonylcarbamoyladenosine biosynthesis protein TsaB
MYFVSFETSSKIFSLAVNKDGKVLRYRNLKAAMVLEDSILPALDKILESAGISFDQIDGFAIALGPGSFTSLRVGLSTVKAFAMSTGKPVVGIPTLDIIARGVDLGACDEVCVINDARRDKVYACFYGPDGRKSDYLLCSLKEALAKASGRTLFVGDALKLYRKDIVSARQTKCLFADEKWWYPQSRVMSALAYERFKSKSYDDAASLLPIYLYPQDCQVSADKK